MIDLIYSCKYKLLRKGSAQRDNISFIKDVSNAKKQSNNSLLSFF